MSANFTRFVAMSVIGAVLVSPLFAEDKSRKVGDVFFDEALYPGLSDRTDDELRLAGIAALYPGRVKPAGAPVVAAAPEVRKPVVVRLAGGVEYVRPYDLVVDEIVARAGKVPLIVDCRYLAADYSRVGDAIRFGEALAGGRRVQLAVIGDYHGVLPSEGDSTRPSGPVTIPVLILVNSGTSGPLEAVLQELQSRRLVDLVGSRTAGLTGRFGAASSGVSVLSGEVRPASGGSLVGVGVEPLHHVEVDAKVEFLVWQLVSRGASPTSLLGADSGSAAAVAGGAVDESLAAGSGSVKSRDVVLRRAVDIHEALRVLSGASLALKSTEVAK